MGTKPNNDYPYHTFNRYHAYNGLKDRRFGVCLAYGCAKGDDVLPIADQVDLVIGVEPAQQWWSDRIGSAKAEYRMPNVDGTIDLSDQSVDLIVCLGVLHHVPNVSKVITEFARVLSKDGVLVVREPISSMGDWTAPRRGLTKNERGLPLEWLKTNLKQQGLMLSDVHPCMFSLTYKLERFIRLPFNRLPIVTLDYLVASMMVWNIRYWRPSFFSKIAPASVYIIAKKP